MPEQPEDKKSFVWNILLDDLVLAHALCKLPIGGLMKCAFYHNARDLACPPDCCKVANVKYQNYKRGNRNNSKATEQRIQLLDIDYITCSFAQNHYVKTLSKHLEDYMMSCNTKKHSPPPRHPAGGAPKVNYDFEEDEYPGDEEGSYVDESFHKDIGMTLSHQGTRSPIRPTTTALSPIRPTTTTFVGFRHHEKPLQLVRSAKNNANVLGLLVTVGNNKGVTDNGKGYSNYMRLTKQIHSPADYDKTELTR
jgi:hypothetical protein